MKPQQRCLREPVTRLWLIDNNLTVPILKSILNSKVALIYMYTAKLSHYAPPSLGGLLWNKKKKLFLKMLFFTLINISIMLGFPAVGNGFSLLQVGGKEKKNPKPIP